MTPRALALAHALLVSVFFPLLSCTGSAQGARPVVERVVASVEGEAQRVVVDYDVSDADADPLTVALAVSLDSGRTWSRVGAATGDVGAVQPGSGRRIVWDLTDVDRTRLGARALRVRVVADDGAEVDVRSIIQRITDDTLISALHAINGPRHRAVDSTKLRAVRTLLSSRFEAAGLATSTHPFLHSGSTGENIVGDASGLVDGDTVVIVDAHYDTIPTAPGADDNGSGVAGLLAAIEAIEGLQFRRTVRFVGFDFEEDGLIGSGRYVQSLKSGGVAVAGVLNMEMIGYASDEPNSQRVPPGFELLFPAAIDSIEADQRRGNFIAIVANTASDALGAAFESASRQWVPELRVLRLTVPGNGSMVPDLRRSDHARFWDAGYRAIMINDGGEFRNPHYHTEGDSIGTLDIGFMRNVSRAMLATLLALADPMHAGVRDSDPFTLGIATSAQPERPRTVSLALAQNSPNPFAGATTIRFTLPREGSALLELTDALGRRVARLVDGPSDAGEHAIDIETHDLALAPGVYFYRLTFDGQSLVRSLIVH